MDQFPGVTTTEAASAEPSLDVAHPEALRKPTDPDDTASIQAALDAGRAVQLQADKTYVVSAPLVMRSGQRLFGGGPSTALMARDFARSGPENHYTLITNRNYDSSDVTDHDLLVEDLAIDASKITFSNGAFHGVGFRKTERVIVRGVTCRYIGDCTAFQASVDTLVRDSSAEVVTNVAFDHWEGPRNAVVENVSVRCDSNHGGGVMFTGAAGRARNNSGAAGEKVRVSGATILACTPAAIVINALSRWSTISDVEITKSTIDALKTSGAGIIVQGAIRRGIISHNNISNTDGAQGIGLTPDEYGSGTPSNFLINNNVLSGCETNTRNVAPLAALGHSHEIYGNSVSESSSRCTIWVDTKNTVLKDNKLGGGQICDTSRP